MSKEFNRCSHPENRRGICWYSACPRSGCPADWEELTDGFEDEQCSYIRSPKWIPKECKTLREAASK